MYYQGRGVDPGKIRGSKKHEVVGTKVGSWLGVVISIGLVLVEEGSGGLLVCEIRICLMTRLKRGGWDPILAMGDFEGAYQVVQCGVAVIIYVCYGWR